MQILKHVLLIGTLMTVAATTACAPNYKESEVAQIDKTALTGSPFARDLAVQYYILADRYWFDFSDQKVARYFARKGYAAAGGENVMPDNPYRWNIAETARPNAHVQHTRLNKALAGGARELAPHEMALAQASFDCWLAEMESWHLNPPPAPVSTTESVAKDAPSDQAKADAPATPVAEKTSQTVSNNGGCQAQFQISMQRAMTKVMEKHSDHPLSGDELGAMGLAHNDRTNGLDGQMNGNGNEDGERFTGVDGSKIKVVRSALGDSINLVFFDFKSSDLKKADEMVLDLVALEIGAAQPKSIRIIGHTDTAGAENFNMKLGKKRAETVRDALAKRNIPVSIMATESRGEMEPLIQTGDGIRQATNRRVEIIFK